MQAYIIKFNMNLEFYVPFEAPLTVGEVKDEMFLQLEIPSNKMILIYNGQILKDKVLLSDLGVKDGSILFLQVPRYENIFLQSPKRMLNEVLSIFQSINIIPDESLLDAIQTIKKYIESPILKAFSKVLPEITEIFEEIENYIQEIECPYDDSVIETISRIHDNSFYNSEFFESDCGAVMKLESNEVSLYETKCQCKLEPQEDIEISDLSLSDEEEPTNLNYTPCISTAPLPLYDPDACKYSSIF
ncbi:Ubiquitin family protein [Trichomonas vaginalis G3]|uniref:Ubiquitin family protein n=1 Tax=Trichomonas vaginalis (strain ATCC PRA-98 / G3) TaxID=412133 RepID=A2EAN2_TRIV3|nr:ubiquitin-like family [Trichomonas vaginalis G3]EAY10235.1 Ubiquitin family protein [Trichomonas vaginalis G3]KAI5487717.1 ubiquitin-like family [Trichomonas vaginalis G3]|eukprot:XP_001322458.1 Ubiquitin family protein [Trichomonas vaginalis G3]